MIRLILRVLAMAAAVFGGHAIAGLSGALVGACLATVVITQTDDVIRIVRAGARRWGAMFRTFWLLLRRFFFNPRVWRPIVAFARVVFVGAFTALGHELGKLAWHSAGEQMGSIIAAGFAVAVMQHWTPGSPAPPPESRDSDFPSQQVGQHHQSRV